MPKTLNGINKLSTNITTKIYLDKTKTKALTPRSGSSKVKKLKLHQRTLFDRIDQEQKTGDRTKKDTLGSRFKPLTNYRKTVDNARNIICYIRVKRTKILRYDQEIS